MEKTLAARANRRGFLRAGAAVSAATVTGLHSGALFGAVDRSKVTAGDVAVLKFLAAAELIEDDLWQQYCELAVNNPAYRRALQRIDRSLIRYICDDRDDERSHAQLINAFLVAIGETPVNLDPFRTLRSSTATGAESRGRLTNLMALNVDTSWFLRYRSAQNPDFGASFPQFVTITGRPTIPLANGESETDVQLAAHCAAFHFAAIEQGGGSLYSSLITKVTSRDVLRILAAIGPTEVYHFSAFHKSLENLPAFSARNVTFPSIRDNRDLAEAIFPEPCSFLDPSFPLCSVIRPTNNENAGALAAATGLIQSGLFTGQPQAFVDAVTQLVLGAEEAKFQG